MSTFTAFSNRLPDPEFIVNDAGAVDTVGSVGPGFSGVSMSSVKDSQLSRTISGRGVGRESGSHHWEINIKYNPMFRDQFDVVSAFLESRNGRINPFFVVLPQYKKPKNAAFAIFAAGNVVSVNGLALAGSPVISIDAISIFSGTPKPGDFFTINDATDVNHLKSYKVTRVESNATYQIGKVQPTTSQFRIYVSPPLVRNVADNSIINWINPAFRVVQKGDVIENELNIDNLYSFGLNLEEILP